MNARIIAVSLVFINLSSEIAFLIDRVICEGNTGHLETVIANQNA
jgi:hypothetical protein